MLVKDFTALPVSGTLSITSYARSADCRKISGISRACNCGVAMGASPISCGMPTPSSGSPGCQPRFCIAALSQSAHQCDNHNTFCVGIKMKPARAFESNGVIKCPFITFCSKLYAKGEVSPCCMIVFRNSLTRSHCNGSQSLGP